MASMFWQELLARLHDQPPQGLQKGPFSACEKCLLLTLHHVLNNKWYKIASQAYLPFHSVDFRFLFVRFMTFDTILVFCFGRFSTEPTTLLRIIGTPFANALNATFPTAKLPFSLAFVPLLPTLSPPLMHALFIVTRDHFSPTTGHSQQTLPLQFLVALVE